MASLGLKGISVGVLGLLMMTTVLAGCVTGGSEEQGQAQQAPDEPAGPAQFGEGEGAIEGSVLDEEARPIQGAQAGIIEINLIATTDASGRFTLSNLEPGRYSLFVQKLGYESAATSVEVVAGEATQVQVDLVAIAIRAPYMTSWHDTGFFGCSWQIVIATGPCFFPGPQVPFPGNKRQFDYFVAEGTMTVVNDVVWDETTAATGESMSIFLSYTNRTTSHWYCRADSPSPLQLRYDRPDLDADEGECNANNFQLPGGEPQVIPIEGQNLTSRVNTGPSSVVPFFGMAFQQTFEIYFSIFYWENAPEGYTAVPDA